MEVFMRITTFPSETKFLAQLDKHSTKLLQVIRSREGVVKQKTTGILQVLDETVDITIRRECILKSLMIYLGEPVDHLIKEFQEAETEELEQATMAIFVIGKEDQFLRPKDLSSVVPKGQAITNLLCMLTTTEMGRCTGIEASGRWVAPESEMAGVSEEENSDCWRAVSFDPTWTISRLTEDGSECSSPGSFSRMTGTVAPGRQRVAALKNRMFLVMESPIINVVGAKRGRGGAGPGKLPECLSTASLRSLRREEVARRDEGRRVDFTVAWEAAQILSAAGAGVAVWQGADLDWSVRREHQLDGPDHLDGSVPREHQLDGPDRLTGS
ncbi:hypothetical protein F7725_009407 [Dissostichus mawsoni]|uniref:Uncharacterized protein n=1 Tax=Dissostichus mawsoni TaxID=36200 RepID=A0A7J5XM60_DISMA|nr:hypothetical protein F7725_009407 [Dissostichus mawsoni]